VYVFYRVDMVFKFVKNRCRSAARGQLRVSVLSMIYHMMIKTSGTKKGYFSKQNWSSEMNRANRRASTLCFDQVSETYP
jgi:hypothetical protein